MKALLALELVAMAGVAQAHMVGCDGKEVPASIKSSCCGKADVHWLSPEDVSQDGEGDWHVDLGWRQVRVAGKKAEPSPDGCYWIFYPENAKARGTEPPIFCFLIPMGI